MPSTALKPWETQFPYDMEAAEYINAMYDDMDFGDAPLVESLFEIHSMAYEPRRIEYVAGDGQAVLREVFGPKGWSDNALSIVASKYFAEGEDSVHEMIERVVVSIGGWGKKQGYFAVGRHPHPLPDDVKASDGLLGVFTGELRALLYHQAASFNSPVWFNVGVEEDPQCSACFINSVEDTMESIMDLATREALIFKYGSGSGTNLSPLRSSLQRVSGGGLASGPVSFMRGYDAFANVIKSGGKTRRAAKMQILDVDHEDIKAFIDSKLNEEAKAHALIAAGYDGSVNGDAYSSVFFQNSNHSVRVTDGFMATAIENSRSSKIKNENLELLERMAAAAWSCGDPGIQFQNMINDWHTCGADGEIHASNPCSEYLFLDDTACNLASINLIKFGIKSDRKIVEFDFDGFRQAVRVMITAMDIIVSAASYPTAWLKEQSNRLPHVGHRVHESRRPADVDGLGL